MQTNAVKAPLHTHQGGKARHIRPIQALRRSVLSCLLFEREFYESGLTIAERIQSLVAECDPVAVMEMAIEARSKMNLRHAPLLLLASLAKLGRLDSVAVLEVIQRPDEMGELLALLASLNGVGPDQVKKILPNQVKRGIAKAFIKFDRYQLAKYNRPKAITLRDVMFLTHPKPVTAKQADDFRDLAEGNLEAPDTWEVRLSGGEDKRDVFTDLLARRKLGYMAVLRNLRNMVDAGVERDLIEAVILERRGAQRVLPFRFVAAARACPQLEPVLDQALVNAIFEGRKLPGTTIVLVDVSDSMNHARVSAKSDMTRMDAAATLASMVHGEDVRVFTFSDGGEAFRRYPHMRSRARGGPIANGDRVAIEVPPRKGMAGVDAVINSQAHGGTRLGAAVREINQIPHDRLILITDEQTQDSVPDPVCAHPYLINVASARNGVGYGRWTHIDGFSESVLRYIHEVEAAQVID